VIEFFSDLATQTISGIISSIVAGLMILAIHKFRKARKAKKPSTSKKRH
jgi:hypothetical protein